ncbi:hypothetical protein JAAARDRAFT_687068 [Jaapia argillacea MUCL 33604]|uniref:Carbohydrate-binding module family 35 protein n=1 Tax=Jaapia argillacea MUCL 33604 TaxID=933084 RepID=A0A067PUN7_9AGAM|nr:hypothetical protein JAAARDRAFT_687068 [Jaapia argillacea MUCL 33604]
MSINQTVDNIDPLIIYMPGPWYEGSPSDDPLASRYSNDGTFTLSNSTGAAVTFTFDGTGVWLFGALRPNHGHYSVQLDGGTLISYDGWANPEQFQAVLFSAINLPQGSHTVVLSNAGNTSYPYLDVDFITWETEMGSVLEDTDPSFVYDSPSLWTTQPPNVDQFHGGTGHVTNGNQSSTTLTFEVCSFVQVFGSVDNNHGPYTVQVDNGTTASYNANKQNFVPNVLLYSGTFADGKHTIKLTNTPEEGGQYLAIDYAVVSSPR